MSRVANWPVVLAAKIEEWRYRPFSYGSSDCWQFSADVVMALTGIDHREKFPRYASREEADTVMGEGGMLGIGKSALGEPKHISRAMRGDVVLADFGDGIAAGICLGIHCCAPGPQGLVFQLTSSARLAWSI